MSTQIKEIIGRWEKKSHADFTTTYGEASIHINRFAGGKKNGAMIQLTISQWEAGGETSYIQLTQKQVAKLAQVLQDCFDYTKYPSE